MKIREILPVDVLSEIESYFNEKITTASNSWDANQDNEDALTGALGERLATDWSQPLFGDGRAWRWRFRYRKFSSVKFEPTTGADGIFMIEIEDKTKKLIFRKGLLFQAKKYNNRDITKLNKQALNMEAVAPHGSAVFIFGPDRYSALDVREIKDNNSKTIKNFWRNAKTLSEYFENNFLSCKTGIMGMYFDGVEETLITPDTSFKYTIKNGIYINVKGS